MHAPSACSGSIYLLFWVGVMPHEARASIITPPSTESLSSKPLSWLIFTEREREHKWIMELHGTQVPLELDISWRLNKLKFLEWLRSAAACFIVFFMASSYQHGAWSSTSTASSVKWDHAAAAGTGTVTYLRILQSFQQAASSPAFLIMIYLT